MGLRGARNLLTRPIVVVGLVLLMVGGIYVGVRGVRWLKSRREAQELTALVTRAMESLGSPRSTSNSDEALPAIAETIDSLLTDTPFEDIAGKSATFREYRGAVLVVSMTSSTCPISKKLVPALNRLSAEFTDSGVQFLLVNTETDVSRAELAQHAEQFPGWRYVPDPEARLAQTLRARSTTETFVIDAAQTLRYRGALDNRFDIGVNRPVDEAPYLRDAILAILHGEALWRQTTPAPGCLLGLAPNENPATPVTWHNQISRLVRYNCVECHRSGEAAPFALETCAQVVAKKAMIEYVLDERIMPPWFADRAHGVWRNARLVTEAQRQMFRQWVAEGCAEGNADEAPMPLKHASGWSIREPDVVIDVPPQEIPAEGLILPRTVPVEFSVPEDLWVTEAEVRPSVPEVVHHITMFVEYAADDPRRASQTTVAGSDADSGKAMWMLYAPGRKSFVLPQGRAKLFPRGGKLSLSMHYTPSGTPTVDRTRIGLKTRQGPPEKPVMTGTITRGSFRIPPDSLVHFAQSEVFGEDARLLALMPHMHYRGRAAQVFLSRPDGRLETLLNVPHYDFDWQWSYEFVEPLLVTRGSRIIIRHEFDNRATNPKNPDPTQTVVFGDQTTDEMMINFFEWEPAGDEPAGGSPKRPFR
ncbi:MAG: redoxin domain-containing protein [Planctomycetaceae bacterium]